jgi:hypothetical protein
MLEALSILVAPTGLLEVGNVSHPFESMAAIQLTGSPLDPPLALQCDFGTVTKVIRECSGWRKIAWRDYYS